MDESREKMLLCAAVYVSMAWVQRELYVYYVVLAVGDGKAKKSHSNRSYSFVVDYGQNIELPVFHAKRPGPMYYYSPPTISNLGMVNHAHVEVAMGRENSRFRLILFFLCNSPLLF